MSAQRGREEILTYVVDIQVFSPCSLWLVLKKWR